MALTFTVQTSAESTEEDPIQDWKLDLTTGDLADPIQVVRGVDAIAQRLYLRLNMWLGEWKLNREDGTDWLMILGKKYDPQLASTILRDRVETCPGITGVVSLKASFSGRTLSVSIVAQTDKGLLRLQAEGAV